MNNIKPKHHLDYDKVSNAYDGIQKTRNRNCKKILNAICKENNRGRMPNQREIESITGLSQTTISVIATSLAKYDLIKQIRQRQEVRYLINDRKLNRIYKMTRRLFE